MISPKDLDVSLESISYDGTNFYTFIDTFNMHCELARRGKNKQGRTNLRQVSYALFCCEDGQLPLYYDVYEGNRNDAKQFPRMPQSVGRAEGRQATPLRILVAEFARIRVFGVNPRSLTTSATTYVPVFSRVKVRKGVGRQG